MLLHLASMNLFSTSFDGQLAELHAMDLLMQHIDQQLSMAGDPASITTAGSAGPPLRCTASETEVVELAYALYVLRLLRIVLLHQRGNEIWPIPSRSTCQPLRSFWPDQGTQNQYYAVS